MRLLKSGFAPTFRPSTNEQNVSVSLTLWGQTFSNPVGTAASGDQTECVDALLQMGWSHVEIGTVIPMMQHGDTDGVNLGGVNEIEQRLKDYRRGPPDEHPALKIVKEAMGWNKKLVGAIGVAIGRDKAMIEPEMMLTGYSSSIQHLGSIADYLVLDVSSPGINLQDSEHFKALIRSSKRIRDDTSANTPLLIRVSAEVDDEDLKALSQLCLSEGVDGLVVSSKTSGKSDPWLSDKIEMEESGTTEVLLLDRNTECIRVAYSATQGKLPIIGIGGISTGADVYTKLKAGACLVQVSADLADHSFGVASRIRDELAKELRDHGNKSVQDVIGLDHDDVYWKKREAQILQHRKTSTESVLVVDP